MPDRNTNPATPASRAARATKTSSSAAPAMMRLSGSILISLKPRPSRITTPGTPPSRTMVLEPAPIVVTRNIGRQAAQKISQIVLVLGQKEDLRRSADPKPGELGQRLIGQEPPAQFGHARFQLGDDVGEAHSAFNSPGSA